MLEPWNIREPKLEEERRYQNLVDLHRLTQEWQTAVDPPKTGDESFRLHRFVPPQLTQNLWLLEKLRLDQLPPELESLVNATTVTEFLDELEETIWIVQMSLLENMMNGANAVDRASLFNQLEQVTWHHGKNLAEKRWPKFAELFESDRSKLMQRIFESLMDSLYYSHAKSFLTERITEDEITFYWLSSPLSRTALAISPEVSTLCQLHHHGLQGFLYGLIRKLKVEVTPATLRDKKVWNISIRNAL